MKIDTSRHDKDGSVLLVTVITLIVLTIMAVSYLFMLQNDNRFVARDQAWNRALVIAEAGVEEAMAHINSGGEMLNPPPNFGGDSWGASGTNYTMTRSTNLYGGSYTVVVGGSPYMATITSTGMVTAPLSGATLQRIVQVTAPFTSGYQLGIAAITSVNMNGNNINTDSYDSSDTNDFPGGLYNVAHREAHGDIASLDTNLFSIGNANIMGLVHMPAAGVQSDVSIGPNGAVGSVSFVSGGGKGWDTTGGPWFLNDFNSTFPDVQVPYTSGTAISPPGGGATNTISTGTYYYNGNFSIPNNGVLDVGQYSFVEIYVTGTFNMVSQASINIEKGGTLVLYVGGATSSFTYINNNFGNANNFQYFGLPTNTKITLGGNATFMGRIYAPEAGLTLNGSGSTPFDYQGAMLVNTMTSNGHFNMHYDQNLARATNNGTYVVSSWTELPH